MRSRLGFDPLLAEDALKPPPNSLQVASLGPKGNALPFCPEGWVLESVDFYVRKGAFALCRAATGQAQGHSVGEGWWTARHCVATSLTRLRSLRFLIIFLVPLWVLLS